MSSQTSLLEKLLARTKLDLATGCRIWPGHQKYGTVCWRGRRYLGHRLVWELANGRSPGASCVRHTCDNSCCWEPTHLVLGTKRDNTQDAVARGRIARGERNGSHKLTEAQVVEIKKLLATGGVQRRIASAYGVHLATISHIMHNRCWKHVPWPTEKGKEV